MGCLARVFGFGWLCMVAFVAWQCAGPSSGHRAPSLRLLAFNLWQEGTSVEGGFEKIVDVIDASDADVIALSEVRNYDGVDLHGRLKQALFDRGKPYHGFFVGGDVGLLSRYPILRAEPIFDDPDRARGSLMGYWLEVPRVGEVLVAPVHLDYKNYAIYGPRGYDGNEFEIIDPDGDGVPNPITDVDALHAMDAASGRDEILRAFVEYAQANQGPGRSMILAGDFNECSHLDWTEATKDLYSHNGVVIEWKNSVMLHEAGFRDAWRELYPNPVTHPGATWPSEAFGTGSTSWAPKVDERDRIDLVYFRGDLAPRAAWVVGSPRYYVFNQLAEPETDCSFAAVDLPWPSDHKAVMVDFEWPRNRDRFEEREQNSFFISSPRDRHHED